MENNVTTPYLTMENNITTPYLTMENNTTIPYFSDIIHNQSKTQQCSPFSERHECILVRFYSSTIVGGLLCIVGLIGNSVSYVVLSKDRKNPIASLLLQALAVADNFFLIWWLVHIAIKNLLAYMGLGNWTSPIWGPLHIYLYPFLFIGQTCTIWLTVFIAFTRYFAVCRPYSSARVWNYSIVKRGIILISIVSVCYNIPRFFEFHMTHNQFCGVDYYHPIRWLRNSQIFIFIYFDTMYYIFNFGLPFALLSLLNLRLILAYRVVQRRRRAMLQTRGSRTIENGEARVNSELHHSHREPNVTLVMIMVILTFMMCNLPARIVQIVYEYNTPDYACVSLPAFLMELSGVLEALNSSCNFIIYCVFRQQFRTILRQGPCCNSAPNVPNLTTNGRATCSLGNHKEIPLMQPLINGCHGGGTKNGEQSKYKENGMCPIIHLAPETTRL